MPISVEYNLNNAATKYALRTKNFSRCLLKHNRLNTLHVKREVGFPVFSVIRVTNSTCKRITNQETRSSQSRTFVQLNNNLNIFNEPVGLFYFCSEARVRCAAVVFATLLLVAPVQSAKAEEDLVARCQTETCREMMTNLAARKAAADAGEPLPSAKLTKEERRAKRYRERARMEEENKEFSRQKQAFVREERAYLIKYRTMDATALRLESEGVPFEDRRVIVEKAGEDAFNEAMKEQEAYEREQVEYENKLASRRREAADRAANESAAKKLIEQEQKLCKTSICS
mmetsp:Transcript_31329/g.43453  ORF Transcript_31329/g.43453 Transcript_31329/m.43453 type:complete len:286 (-) Transcript_31329:114-971(-)